MTDDRGFSFLDVLTAAVIIVIGTCALASTAATAAQTQRTLHERQLALRALDQQIEQLVATPFANLTKLDGTGFDIDPDTLGLNSLPGMRGTQPGSIAVSAPAPISDPGVLVEVTLRIDWIGARGVQEMERTVRFSAIGALP